jgi:hypothetical protein
MRHLTYATIQKVIAMHPEYAGIENFLETGTYKGGTIFPMSKHFKKLHTIEICEKAYQFCVEQGKKNKIKNIDFYLGDSIEKVAELIPKINARTVYFLDGHVTQNNTGFTGKGVKDVPVLEELKSINELDPNASMIIIDDIRMFGMEKSDKTAGADWSDVSLERVLAQLSPERIKAHFTDPDFDPAKKTAKPLENDRYIVLLNAKV